jgi:carbamoylphosphate synthase small subunit
MSLKEKKKNFAEAFFKKGCNISEACKAVEISRPTYYDWLYSDEEFKAAIEEAQEKLIDFTESKLVENIQSNDTRAIIFMLKTKGKNRGYIEKSQTEISGGLTIKDAVKELSDSELEKKIKELDG